MIFHRICDLEFRRAVEVARLTCVGFSIVAFAKFPFIFNGSPTSGWLGLSDLRYKDTTVPTIKFFNMICTWS